MMCYYLNFHFQGQRLINQLDTLISQIYFGMKLYMFRTVPQSIIRSFFTLHTAMVYVIQVCGQLSSRILILLASCQHDLYNIYHCCVYSEKTPDDGQGTVRNM